MIIDATNLIVGRLGTAVAKKAILGETVDIVNCEKAVITGRKEIILGKYKAQSDRGGPMAGPFLPKQADRFLKRAIRGMISYKNARGSAAFKRIKCYKGLPPEFEGKETETLENAQLPKKITNYLTVNELTNLLRMKNE
jgi:large subunit ribosomal protein L13